MMLVPNRRGQVGERGGLLYYHGLQSAIPGHERAKALRQELCERVNHSRERIADRSRNSAGEVSPREAHGAAIRITGELL